MSMKNSSDTIGNRTRDLQTCGAVPQPNAPPPYPLAAEISFIFTQVYLLCMAIENNVYCSIKSLVCLFNVNMCQVNHVLMF